ncbi:MAG: leucine-rich repeat domain-containing protein [Clostridia bacterium]
MKRLLSIFLAVAMVVSMAFIGGTSAFAANGNQGTFLYTVSGTDATITGYLPSALANPTEAPTLTIPSTLDGYNVVAIGDYGLFSDQQHTSIVIPSSVTTIGANAFAYAAKLTSITIPNTVTSVGASAYANCLKVTSASIGTGITTIPAQAFSGDELLTTVTIPNNVTTISNNAFEQCVKLSTISIGTGVTSIGDAAFIGDRALTTVTIPNNVLTIGVDAFNGCNGMTSFAMGTGVTTVGDSAFEDCTGLTTFTIGSGVTSVNDYAFSGCTGLTSMTIGANVSSIGAYVFQDCSALTSINIPANLASLGGYDFDGCAALATITAAAANASYSAASGVLFNKDQSSLIQFPAGKAGTYVVPDSVLSVESYAFYNAKLLTNVTILSGTESIGDYSFAGCTGLTSFTIPDTLTSIGNLAFIADTSLTEMVASNDNVNYSSQNGVLYNKDASTLIQYPVGKTGSYVIPGSVTSIGDDAFYACKGLSGITIPTSVTSIGSNSFFGCDGLASVSVPANVTSIGTAAFANCATLTQINVNSSNANYESQSGVLFNHGAATVIQFPAGKTGTYTIPSTVTKIDDYSFNGAVGLTTVTIPASVTEIGSYAFQGCTLLTKASMLGDAPTGTEDMFSDCAESFMVWYIVGKTGYEDPWYGFPTRTTTHAVTFTSNSIADLLNTGDTVYDAYMNTAGATLITARATYLSTEILATATLDTVTKAVTFPTLVDGNYVLTVSRNGYMTRDIAVVVNAADVALADKSLIAGDVYIDGIIDGSDSEGLFSIAGFGYGDPLYLVEYDLNLDGIIDGTDTETLFSNLGSDSGVYNETINYYN